MLRDPASWPDSVISGVAADLFPTFLEAHELIDLIRRNASGASSGREFGGAIWEIVRAVDPASEPASSLRDALADLIWETRASDSGPYYERSACGRFAPDLAVLCSRLLQGVPQSPDEASLHACVVSSRFSRGQGGWEEPVGKLRKFFESDATLRRDVFWAELAFVDKAAPNYDCFERFYHAQHDSLVGRLVETDRPWLEETSADSGRPDRSPIALLALVQLWHDGGEAQPELERLRALVRGDPTLEALLAERTLPPRPEAIREREEFDREQEQRSQLRNMQASKDLASWQQWRAAVMANPADAFAPEKLLNTLSRLLSWLRRCDQNRNRWDVWDRDSLAGAFDENIATRTETALREHWRRTEPVPWSQRPAEEKNAGPPGLWVFGLMGLSAESSTPGWAECISPDEARIATLYATIEMNGFAQFLTDLLHSHPSVLQEVLGTELSKAFEVAGDHRHLPVLSHLSYADSSIKRALISGVIKSLQSWPATFNVESEQHWALHLDDVLGVLAVAETPAERTEIAGECARRYESDPAGLLAPRWLTGLFRADAHRGTEVLVSSLTAGDPPLMRERAVELIAALFGDRDPSLLAIDDATERAGVLGRLVRCAYTYVRREDDQVHDEPYSPDVRDNAETGRSFLLSALYDTPAAETCRILMEFANETAFAGSADRLRLLARQRAAADADLDRGNPEDIVALDSRLETPACDGGSLFQVMMGRLEDLKHDCEHGDFSPRASFRNARDEAELRTILAGRLNDHANGAYLVAQEEEVADANRTDIRLRVIEGDRKAVIEIKVVENWSGSELRTALRAQLVGKYLRHESCRHGCLFLAYQGKPGSSGSPKQRWGHPETGQLVGVNDIAKFLRKDARSIKRESCRELQIEVFLLDVSDTRKPLS